MMRPWPDGNEPPARPTTFWEASRGRLWMRAPAACERARAEFPGAVSETFVRFTTQDELLETKREPLAVWVWIRRHTGLVAAAGRFVVAAGGNVEGPHGVLEGGDIVGACPSQGGGGHAPAAP